ncbi:MAG TPA: SUMF1/EgtB/PvdO family nonheme iron enzyme [Labilithrix sp.]|jgi:formylglycine-generating enzyme required for sulfatase activity|nr:SUMF1/EgtB/PvdO family nonheme iron enzyme [Labilithrix sp.]
MSNRTERSVRSLRGARLVDKRLFVAALVLALPIPFAFAQDNAAKPESGTAVVTPPGPTAATSSGATVATPAPATSTASSPASAAAQHIEADGEEPDHTPPTPAPKPTVFVRQTTAVKDGMVRIPGGRFTMGTDDKKAPPNERPSRVVVLPPFWIDKTEVTVGAYRACVERGPCPRPARTSSLCTYDLGDPALPVSCVPWTSAQAYCIAVGKRLPREVEWEMAARGSSGAKYPWGGASAAGCGPAVTLASDATQRSCGGKKPARVGSHPSGASPYGVLDMSGNVEEWVADWYHEGNSDFSPRAGASHVLRGGGWLSHPSQAKTTSRNWGSAREMGPNVGFRCAKDDHV